VIRRLDTWQPQFGKVLGGVPEVEDDSLAEVLAEEFFQTLPPSESAICCSAHPKPTCPPAAAMQPSSLRP